jgi:hypothetical protein
MMTTEEAIQAIRDALPGHEITVDGRYVVLDHNILGEFCPMLITVAEAVQWAAQVAIERYIAGQPSPERAGREDG